MTMINRCRGSAAILLNRARLVALLLLLCGVATAQNRSVAITFDDLPGMGGLACRGDAVLDVNNRLLAQLVANEVPSIGFVNEGRPCPQLVEDVLNLWMDAGMELGNHTATHPDINDLTAADYLKDIVDGEKITRRLIQERGMGSLRYFRHPFLHTGDSAEKKSAVEAFLRERGYTIAPVTIDNDEWLFARAYARALAGDASPETLRRIETTYVEWLDSVVAHFETWSVEVVGYEIAQVLLLHANEINAATFGDIAALFVRRGYRFITLEEALRDPGYAQPDPYVGEWGISWLHRWARGKGLEVQWEPDAPEWIADFGN